MIPLKCEQQIVDSGQLSDKKKEQDVSCSFFNMILVVIIFLPRWRAPQPVSDLKRL